MHCRLISSYVIRVFVCFVFVAGTTEIAFSQSKNKVSADPQATVPRISANQMTMMVRSAILALNNANLTGNYTVLRDLGAPGFQNANSSARLSEAFSDLRERKIDLTPIMLYQIRLSKQPTLNKNGLLRLTGVIPTQPQQVNFDLLYQRVRNKWRIFGMAVDTSQSKAVSTSGRPIDRKPQKTATKNSSGETAKKTEKKK